MGYWTKYFTDGTELRAEDSEVSRGLKSWSKTNCYLLGATVNHGGVLELLGLGEYWHSETYEVSTNDLTPTLIKFRLEKKILVSDTLYSMWKDGDNGLVVRIGDKPWHGQTRTMPPGTVDKWFVLEYDLVTKSVRTYFSSEKV